jgi:hypothetical protein
VQDTGTTANRGANLSAVQSATINVTAVNDPPTFLGGPAMAGQDSDKTGDSFTNWAQFITKGPADEAGQSLSGFEVTADDPSLFSVQPAVDPVTGNLTFTPAPNAHGDTVVTVRLQDSGGTANGGGDTSGAYTFHITIEKPKMWHNTLHALDVVNGNGGLPGDGVVSAVDALNIINYINANGPGPVPPNTNPLGYYDTVAADGSLTGDNFISAVDALNIINWINANGANSAGPDGEGEGAASTAFSGPEGEATDSVFFDMGSQAMNTAAASSTPQQQVVATPAASASQQLDDVIAFLASDSASEAARRKKVFG